MKKHREWNSPGGLFRKLLRIMKLTSFLILLFAFTVSASSYSQTTKLNIQVKNGSFIDVLKQIENQSEFYFYYNNDEIRNIREVSISISGKRIEEVLDQLLRGTDLEYQIIDRYIALKRKSGAENTGVQQQKSVSGKVTDTSGAPLPGVSVVVKGSTNGTITDGNGDYSLPNVPENATLQFSFVGMKMQDIPVSGKTLVNVIMEEDAIGIEEVVAVGYGTMRKRDLTGSIASVKTKDLQSIPSAGADAMLQGKAAGVQVIQNSGTPGAEVFVRVRGTGSLMGENRPLYVVDGVPMNNISGQFLEGGGQRSSGMADINPNDIESMEILKDAASTAIYGSRGSNGVILITTKKGKSGDAKFTFDAYTGVQETWKKLDLLNGEQYYDLIKDELANSGRNKITDYPFNSIYVSPDGKSTDYQDEIFRVAPISSYNLAISGGNEKLKTYTSVGYFTQTGTIIGQKYDRLTTRVNLDYQAKKWLKIGSSTQLSHVKNAKVTNDYSSASVLGNALLRNPNLPVKWDDGTYSVDVLQSENPVQLANTITYNSTQKRIITNLYAEAEIINDLKFKSTFGVDNLSTREERFVPSFIIYEKGSARANAESYEEMTWQNENTLNYFKTFGKQSLTLLAGMSFMESTKTTLRAGGKTAGSDVITTIAIATADIPTHYIANWGLESYFGRANYNFDDKYMVDASIRMDGSSRFGENKRFGTFPSVSVAWRLSNENFMKSVSVISDLKLRASIGATGNQDGLPEYPSLALYGTGRNYDGNPGIAISNIQNADLGWESTTQTNIGVDISLFEGRVSLYADAYKKLTSDLIFTRNLPWTTGFWSIPRVNLGDMENKGLEFQLSTRNLTGKFKWNTDFNISFNRNKITYLPENGVAGSDYIFQMPNAYGSEGPYSIYKVGQPVGSFYGYQYLGVYASDADVPRSDNPDPAFKDFYEKGVRGGDAIYLDVNGDHYYSRDFDRVMIGNALPKHTGGITNTFSYKGFDLSLFMNWSYGNDVYNMTKAVLEAMSDDFNQSTIVLNRWKKQGDVTNIPRAFYGSNSVSGAANTDASSRYIEDGSFLRVKNLTLGYSLPSTFVSKAKITSARIYFDAQNLYTFTNYSGMDPENQNMGGGMTLGVDYLTQPQPRVFSVGVNIGF